MDTVRVGLGDRAYDIVIGRGVRNCIAQTDGFRRFLITDSNVVRHWGAWVAEALRCGGEFTIPAGEASKNFQTILEICRSAARECFDRKSLFVALGGGVVGDMTGFAAAIYMRGVDFIQIPTTLLAMVDSSVGGKTGVDIPEGKNLIGAFHQPRKVLIDPDFLTTLPLREIRCGLAEILKTGVIFDAGLFEELERSPETLTTRPDWKRFIPLIRRSCERKSEVVAADEREAGVRALLNYGHTFGHAVELLSDFSVSHGEGVAVGMCCAGELSARLGRWSRADAQRQKRAIAALGLPTALDRRYPSPSVLEAMRRDKKNSGGAITLVLPDAIGKASVVKGVPDAEIISALEAVYA